jgi:hypothetical protein
MIASPQRKKENVMSLPLSLDDALDDFKTEEVRQAFVIDDDQKAAWAMRKLRSLRAKQKVNEEIAAEEIARVNAWLESVNKTIENDAEYFVAHLSGYGHRVRLNPDDPRKSVTLPHGKISTRQSSRKWSVDSDIFLDWARKSAPDLIRIKEEPALTKIKEAYAELVVQNASVLEVVTKDGEIVPGLTIEEGSLSVSVEVEL